MASDRIFGLVATLTALAYIAGATQVQTGFMPDPVGPMFVPVLVGALAAICGLVMVLRPDPDPEWPRLRTFGALAVALAVLAAYAFALKPLGFLIPTAVTAGILSYQISPRPAHAALTGAGLSAGLFVLFKYLLDLGLVALPKSLTG